MLTSPILVRSISNFFLNVTNQKVRLLTMSMLHKLQKEMRRLQRKRKSRSRGSKTSKISKFVNFRPINFKFFFKCHQSKTKIINDGIFLAPLCGPECASSTLVDLSIPKNRIRTTSLKALAPAQGVPGLRC